MGDWSAAPIVWLGEPPTSETVAKVREDIAKSLKGLGRPEKLIFHTVCLTRDDDGPCVMLYGGEEGTFKAEYRATLPDGLKFDLGDFPNLEAQIRKAKAEDDE